MAAESGDHGVAFGGELEEFLVPVGEGGGEGGECGGLQTYSAFDQRGMRFDQVAGGGVADSPAGWPRDLAVMTGA